MAGLLNMGMGPGLLGGQQPSQGMPRVSWKQNPVVTALGASMIAGPNVSRGFENFSNALPAAMQAKSGMQQFLLANEEKQAAKAEAEAEKQADAAMWNTMIIARSKGEQPAADALARFYQRAPAIADKWWGPQEPAKLPTSVQEWEYGQENPAFAQHQLDLKKAGGTTVNVGGESGADSKLRTKLSEAEGERWSGLQKTGNIAAARAQDFEVLEELLQSAPQGPIVGRLAEMFPGFSTAGDAANAIVKRLAPTMRVEGSGSTSDIEYAGMLASLPSLGKDPQGNLIILETMKAKAQIDMERAAVVTAYQNQQIDANTARNQLAELDRRSILSPKAKALVGGGPAPSSPGIYDWSPDGGLRPAQ